MFAIGGRPPCAARKREASRLLALNIEHARVAPSDAARPRMDLRQIYRVDGQPVGDPRECHAVAIDARAPKFDGGIVTRLDCVSLGIVVNHHGERFYDEGEDFWPKR